MSSSPPASPDPAASQERSRLAQRLRRVIRGEVLFDAGSRGRYATDASRWRVEPLGVVVPADEADVLAALELARELDVPVLLRGAGGSRAGQALGAGLVLDTSRHLNRIIGFDAAARSVEVQPGLTAERLNARLAAHGLWLPVDVETMGQATLGGLVANDAAGPYAIVRGSLAGCVQAIDAVLADGTHEHFGPFGARATRPMQSARTGAMVSRLFEIAGRERDEILRAWPRVAGRVGGFDLDAFCPLPERRYTDDGSVNLAHLLLGSQGTLAHFRRLHLRLAPLPAQRVLAAWRLSSPRGIGAAVRAAAGLEPSALELLDAAMLEPLRSDPAWRALLDTLLEGAPQAVLIAEFAGEEREPLLRRLRSMLGLADALERPGALWPVTEAPLCGRLWSLRSAAIRRLPSPRTAPEAMPAEDFVVPFARLDDWLGHVDELLRRQGLRGAWYGSAGAGALRLRPVPDPRGDPARLCGPLSQAAAMARTFGGAYPGDAECIVADAAGAPAAGGGAGAGLAGSPGAAAGTGMGGAAAAFGPRLNRAFEEIKALFDPQDLLNPGRVVRTRRGDARGRPPAAGRATGPRVPLRTALDWSEPPAGGAGAGAGNGAGVGVGTSTSTSTSTSARDGIGTSLEDSAGTSPRDSGLVHAVAACDGNGACRALDAGAMCPSYRVTLSERDTPRGRANTLRLALEGRFGPRGLAAPEVAEAMSLCVGCKACRSECPAGVDLSRMRIEVLHQQQRAGRRPGLRERALARLPDWAPLAARLPWLFNLRDRLPGLPALGERLFGLARRPLPRWRRDTFLRAMRRTPPAAPGDADVLLLADCFDNHFEPENLHAAMRVLTAAGSRVAVARPAAGDPRPSRPLCCGRSLLAAGLVDEARAEAARTVAALAPFVERGAVVVGLEPECLLTMRDEYLALGLGEPARRLAGAALLLEEFLVREQAAGRPGPRFGAPPWTRAVLHGHCHQHAFDAVRPAQALLAQVPGLAVDSVAPGCCGMAGGFGYAAANREVSDRMAGLALLPALQAAPSDAVIVADGFGCRRQVADAAGRQAWHLARVLDACLADRTPPAAGAAE